MPDNRRFLWLFHQGCNGIRFCAQPMPRDPSEQIVDCGLDVLAQQAVGCHTAVIDAGPYKVVLDTNVLVAAGFNPGSRSAQRVAACAMDACVWFGTTRLGQRSSTSSGRSRGCRGLVSRTCSAPRTGSLVRRILRTHLVPDPADRKFAALADARPGAAGHLGCWFAECGQADGSPGVGAERIRNQSVFIASTNNRANVASPMISSFSTGTRLYRANKMSDAAPRIASAPRA